VKISFLCNTFDPGHDGVGDYVARFAEALSLAGHRVQAVALADRRAAAVTTATDDTGRFEVVRVPAAAWTRGDILPAVQALERFQPDWLSLQMSPYGYEARGLLLRSTRAFNQLRAFGRRHLMLHEIWIGEASGSSVRERIIGRVQRALLLRLIQSWSPELVHTSNPVYRELLRRQGISAQLLPLPGNIPIVDIDGVEARCRLLARMDLPEESPAPMLAGVFGSIHPEWVNAAVLRRLQAAVNGRGRRLVVAHFGRIHDRGRALWILLQKALDGQIPLTLLGELPAVQVSEILQGLDFGIATSPWALVGKSGTVAAMLEHGLPVVVTRDDYRLRTGGTPEPEPHPLLHRLNATLLDEMARQPLGRATAVAGLDMFASFARALSGTP
jgi:glycosyltransferase involved in cell wall biosynthesis